MQVKRPTHDARVVDLFVTLHDMIFTNVHFDEYQPMLSRFVERLDIEGAEENEWIMMGVVNIAGILEYGHPSGVLHKLGFARPKDAAGSQQAATMRVMAKKAAAGVAGGMSILRRW